MTGKPHAYDKFSRYPVTTTDETIAEDVFSDIPSRIEAPDGMRLATIFRTTQLEQPTVGAMREIMARARAKWENGGKKKLFVVVDLANQQQRVF